MNALPRSFERLLRVRSGSPEARRFLELGLDALLEVVPAADALVAVVPPDGAPHVRVTPGLSFPSEAELRGAAQTALSGVGAVRIEGTSRALVTVAAEVGEETIVLAVADVAEGKSRQAFRRRALPVVLGIARASLLERERRRDAEVDRLNATTDRVASSLDPKEVLPEIVRDAVDLLAADSGDIVLRDEGGDLLRVVAVSNFPPDMLGFELQVGEGVSSRAMANRRPIVVSDYQRYRHRIRRLEGYGFRAVLCAPLIARGEPIGAISVHARDAARRFEQRDARLLMAFANHAAIAIDNASRYQNEARLARELATANEQLGRSLTLQQRLVDQVLRDGGAASVAAELATLLDRPVAVQDHLLRVIAGAAPGDQDEWKRLPLPREPALQGELRAFLDDIATSGRAALAPPLDGTGRVVAPVRVGAGDVAGYLVLPSRKKLSPLDRALIEVAATGVALELAKVRREAEIEHRLRGDIVMDLVTGGFSAPDAIGARAAHLGYDLSEPRHVVMFELDHAQAASAGSQNDLVSLERRFFDAVQSVATSWSRASMVARHGTMVIVLAPGSATGLGEPRGGPRALVDRVKNAMHEEVPGVTLAAAISDLCRSLADYQAAFRLAEKSLSALRRLGKTGFVVDARDAGIHRLILSAASPNELQEFARGTLAPLLEDGDHGRELISTLRTYVETGFNQRETARRCYVHVNTVAYRLRRISSLLGVDFSSAESLLDLAFALRIADLEGLFESHKAQARSS